jgi:hypothetical protein
MFEGHSYRLLTMGLFVSVSGSFWLPKTVVNCQTLNFSVSFYKICWDKNHRGEREICLGTGSARCFVDEAPCLVRLESDHKGMNGGRGGRVTFSIFASRNGSNIFFSLLLLACARNYCLLKSSF